MALTTMKQLVDDAWRQHTCVPAFNVGSLEMVRGALQAAEELGTPVIIQIAERLLKYSPLELIGPGMVQAAREASVPVAVNFDHSRTRETIQRALDYGFTGVMYDGSTDPYEENIAGTAAIAELAKSYGASVEGELGLVGGSEEELTLKMDRLGEVAEAAGAYDTLVVWTDNLKKDVWAARSAFLTVIEAETRLLDEMDVVVPVDRIAEFLVYTHDEAEKQGVYVRSFGHAGDGNLHIYCCSNDLEEDEFKRRVKIIMDAAYTKCAELEGQVSGEHSIGHAKMVYLRESVGEDVFGLMQQIKAVFDPDMILNPGKVCDSGLAER